MRLYNLVFGEHDHADLLLSCLGLSKGDFGRFRPAYIGDGQIVVYTRVGGGNREDYESVFVQMQKHPNFLRDEDDDFD